jgi:hypothetical protein
MDNAFPGIIDVNACQWRWFAGVKLYWMLIISELADNPLRHCCSCLSGRIHPN